MMKASCTVLLASAGLLMAGAAEADSRHNDASKPAEIDPCVAAYGPGFKSVPGSSVCLKVSGYVRTTFGFGHGNQNDNGKP